MNQTIVENVQTSRGNIRSFILNQIGKLRIASMNALIESSERRIEFKSLGAKRYSLRSYIPTATNRLIKRGLLEWNKNKSGKSFLVLTELGKAQMFSDISRMSLESKNKSKWDNKWRVIIFDIKEMKRFWRTRLREELYRFGFVMIQKSVWLSPHQCEDFVSLLKTHLKVGKEVIYLTVDRFDGDIWLRKRYGLI